LPTIGLLNEAPHQLPPQHHKGIIAKQQRFHTARVKRRPINVAIVAMENKAARTL
jgi:hypothetical protein